MFAGDRGGDGYDGAAHWRRAGEWRRCSAKRWRRSRGRAASAGSDVLKDDRAIAAPGCQLWADDRCDFGGYGFPSGHVYGDCVVYGLLAVMAPAWVSPRFVPVVRAACVAIIVLAGPVRVVIGAHWPSDVLGGYLWGMAAVALATWFGRWVAQRR